MSTISVDTVAAKTNNGDLELTGKGTGTVNLPTGFKVNNVANSFLSSATNVTVAEGGTGAGTFTDNGILYGNGTGAIAATAVGTATQVLTSNGTGVAPTFQDTPSASDTVAGIVELATNAESITGTDTERAITPAAMRAALVDGNDTVLGKFNLKDYGEIVNAIGATGGGTQDIDLTLGNVVSATVDTSANTFTFSNPTATGKNCGFILYLTNGGSQTVNWPAAVDWPAATAPTLTEAGVDILVFNTTDAGTTWYGNLVGAAYA